MSARLHSKQVIHSMAPPAAWAAPPAGPRLRPTHLLLPQHLDLLVGHKLDGVKGQVAQHEGAVASVQPAEALTGNDAADGVDGALELACLQPLLHHLCRHARYGRSGASHGTCRGREGWQW
jgi:hypothetical protein